MRSKPNLKPKSNMKTNLKPKPKLKTAILDHDVLDRSPKSGNRDLDYTLNKKLVTLSHWAKLVTVSQATNYQLYLQLVARLICNHSRTPL